MYKKKSSLVLADSITSANRQYFANLTSLLLLSLTEQIKVRLKINLRRIFAESETLTFGNNFAIQYFLMNCKQSCSVKRVSSFSLVFII